MARQNYVHDTKPARIGIKQPACIFIDWLNYLQIADDEYWALLGDCKMYRSTQDRDKAGGNMNDVMTFNHTLCCNAPGPVNEY
jgi:hypothetical protein